ncbi:tyrosine-type recombinase/integrase [Microbispora sp. H10885]|uniref:tyrosine-type recombinase/integrase n=1 Tax=Microbispora sp. H10885 TaxID=2729110 RepID=UPI001603824F|nr:tyrosine-type recombinase/integrase [Microbispora sp. H10885]
MGARQRAATDPLHDLRHGTASLALATGADLRVVQGTLGHGSIVVTSDIYTSVLPEVYHRSAQAIARLVMARARATAREARKIAAWPHDAGMPHTCLTISRRLHGSR